jgi:hypothetical protein
MTTLDFISIDIETRNLKDDQIAFESDFLKSHPNTKDETKKESQIAAKKNALVARGALTNSCEIACIGIYTSFDESVVLHTFDYVKEVSAKTKHIGYSSESEMLKAFCDMLDNRCDEETEIVVANAGFDLPKLRLAAIRCCCKIPNIFLPQAMNSVFDVLSVAKKYFLVSSSTYAYSLAEVGCRFGLMDKDKIISGSEIPGMIDKEEFEKVILYNGIDAMIAGKLYMMMTGRIQRNA